MDHATNRRQFLTRTGAAGAALAAAASPASSLAQPSNQPADKAASRRYQDGASPWPICLDTATIRPASVREKLDIAASAGYDAIEYWDRELAEYEENGGDLKDLGKRIKDRGLFAPSVIGLWNAIPPTQEEWEQALPDHRNRMRMASAIGAEHIQVVPQPRRPWEEFDLKWAAARYRDLLEMGLNDYDINPAMVFVEFLPGVARMGQAAAIALDADHPKAKIIPDVFHMYIGDSGFHGLKHLQGDFIAIFQFNDAPDTPSKEKLEDKHRVYPGDGILPLGQTLQDLQTIGYTGCVSLELYNPDYWEQDLQKVAETGLRKTVEVIAAAV